jgi:hypothetical protein
VKGHQSDHTPDLTGLKSISGFVEVLRRGPDYAHTPRRRSTQWIVLDKFGGQRLIRAGNLFNGSYKGEINAKNSGLGCNDKNGDNYPEYLSVVTHHRRVFNKNDRGYISYRNMKFFDAWNPGKGGSFIVGCHWIRKNLGPRPSSEHQLHVLKTKKHPNGFFGPGGIVWRHKMDRHDQDALDVIAEWPRKKQIQFYETELLRLNKAA